MSNQIYLTFLHKILYGFGFGFGMGLSWKLFPSDRRPSYRRPPEIQTINTEKKTQNNNISNSNEKRPYWGTARG